MFFNIEDYFNTINESTLSSSEIKDAYRIRDEINSFQMVPRQVEYIDNRRKSTNNRRFDYKVYGIPTNSNLDRKLYSEVATANQQNDNWTGEKEAEIQKMSQMSSKMGAIKSSIMAIIKPVAIVLALFIIANVVVYVAGVVGSVGETPFNFCKNGETSGPTVSVEGGAKVKDGYKMPIDYAIAGDGYTGQGWDGDDEIRGKGVFASENFGWGGDDSFSVNNYAVSSRWEYVSYTIGFNMWPGHTSYGNGTSDGVDIGHPYTNLDSNYYSWVVKQKVLIFNPDNGKAVVAMVGNGVDNPNWGGSPLNTVGGLSYKAQEALGFKAGGLDGGDYKTNVRDSHIELEMFWVDENSEVGVADSVNTTSSAGSANNACGANSSVGGGNASIADAAVTLAHENMEIAIPNSGPNNGNGTDLYINIHDKVLPGDPWYQSCDRFSATAVRWAGADDSYPAGATGNILDYLQVSDKWEEVQAKSEADMMPGDIIIKTGHVIVYAGLEAVQKRFPNSTDTLAHASIGHASSPEQQTSGAVTDNRAGAIGAWYNMGLKAAGDGEFRTFRNVAQEDGSIYKDIEI